MKNSSATTVRTITSWEAQTSTGIPAPAIVAWISNGHLPAEKSMKGEREIYRFTLLALAQHLLTPEAGKHQFPTVMVPVGDITLDPTYQLRAKTQLSLVREYSQLITAGKKMPPIQLVRLPADKGKPARLIITDGWHRYYAHQHAGATNIPAQIIEYCGEAEAFALALAANGSHGLRRSKADNRHMIEAKLARPEYAALSYR